MLTNYDKYGIIKKKNKIIGAEDMENLKLEIGDFLQYVDNEGLEGILSDEIEKLEGYLEACNSTAAKNQAPLVEDAVYDRLIDILHSVKPDSELLNKTWSEDEADVDENVDIQLVKHPMFSIRTVKELREDEMSWFLNNLPNVANYYAGFKLNGHGIRVVLNNGVVVKATSRGRSTLGRDITRQVRLLMPGKIERLDGFGIVELRGELVLPFCNLEKGRIYNPEIKSAFSGVASLSRDSASDEEIQLLKIVFYNIYSDNLSFDSVSAIYDFLETECELEVPLYWTFEGVSKEDVFDVACSLVEDAGNVYEDEEDPYDIYTDGIVFGLDNLSDVEYVNNSNENEYSGKYRLDNCALKVGVWKQDLYEGIIDHIEWSKGKTKVTPVAVLEEPVLTATGNSVRNVPLYGANYILMLEAYPGRIINFRYGGEAGVVPCTPAGIPLAKAHVQYRVDNEFEVEGYDY